MAYRYRRGRERIKIGSWELVALLAVLVGWYASSVLLSHVIGFNLSGLSTLATYIGYGPPDQTSHNVVGYVPGYGTSNAGAPPVLNAPSPADTYCDSGQTPHFANGFQILKDQLGDVMGAPNECEHVIDQQGNTQQQTTTGVASYNKQTNTTIFTQGSSHWEVNATGLTQWTGDTPPAQ